MQLLQVKMTIDCKNSGPSDKFADKIDVQPFFTNQLEKYVDKIPFHGQKHLVKKQNFSPA